MEEVKKYKTVYFPIEGKYSVWDDKNNLIKEWFDTKEEALQYIEDNLSNELKD